MREIYTDKFEINRLIEGDIELKSTITLPKEIKFNIESEPEKLITKEKTL